MGPDYWLKGAFFNDPLPASATKIYVSSCLMWQIITPWHFKVSFKCKVFQRRLTPLQLISTLNNKKRKNIYLIFDPGTILNNCIVPLIWNPVAQSRSATWIAHLRRPPKNAEQPLLNINFSSQANQVLNRVTLYLQINCTFVNTELASWCFITVSR